MSVEHFIVDLTPPIPVNLTKENPREKIFHLIHEFGMNGPVISTDFGEDGGLLFMFTGKEGKRGSQLTLRSFPTGLVTLDIMTMTRTDHQQVISTEDVEKLFNALTNTLTCHKSRRGMFPFKRGSEIHNYEYTTDNRLVEYDFDRTLVDVQSAYQHIKVLHSEQFGNCLILDSLINIAESDLVYTQSLLGSGRHSFKDKTVLILGGGDGGILHELLKEDPKFVTMVEIDEMVIDCCRKYLRGVCGSSLDNLRGRNYEIFIRDCFPLLDRFIEEGRKFDFVISDLTDVPLSNDEETESQWELLTSAICKGLRVLKPKGFLLTHTTGVSCTKTTAQFEERINSLPLAVEMSSEKAYVPSFQELWQFYEIKKKESS